MGRNGLAELDRRLCCCSCCCCSCRRHPRYRHRSRFRGADPSRSAWRRTRWPRQWRWAYRYHATVWGGHAPRDWQIGGAEEGRSEEECRSDRCRCNCGRKWSTAAWHRCTQAAQYIRIGYPAHIMRSSNDQAVRNSCLQFKQNIFALKQRTKSQ